MQTLYILLFHFLLDGGVLCLCVIRCRGSGEYELCRISVTTWISLSFLFFLVSIVFCLEIILEISLCVQVDGRNGRIRTYTTTFYHRDILLCTLF